MTKLGLLGDIHAEDERLAAALQIFDDENTEAILFVGDVVDGEGDIDRCCALLAAAGAVGVRGNHDRWLIEDTVRSLPHAHLRTELTAASIALLEALPATCEIESPLGPLLLCHGVGESDMRRLWPHDEGYALETNDELAELLRSNHFAVVVGGHTHERMVRRFRAADARVPGHASLLFVNPGTLKRADSPGCAILDFAASCVRFFDLDDPAAPIAAESQPFASAI